MFVRVCKVFFFFLSESLTLGSGAWPIDMLLGPQCVIETLLCFTLIHKIVVNGETATQTKYHSHSEVIDEPESLQQWKPLEL